MNSPTPHVESIHLAGDRGTGHGHATDFDMTGAAHAKVKLTYAGRYARPFAELTIECEVYKAPDGMLSVNTICPRCGRHSLFTQAQKTIELDGDKLYIEKFTCKFLMSEARRADANRDEPGRCGFTCAYDGKVVRDA